MGSERRYAKRVVSENAVGTVVSDGKEIRCLLVNVSVGGMALMTAAGQELSRFVRLRADLGEGWPQMGLDAIVRRREKKGGRLLWGVEFYRAQPHILSQIENFVRANDDGSGDEPVKLEAEPREKKAPRKVRKKAKRKLEADAHLKGLYSAAMSSVGAVDAEPDDDTDLIG